MKIVVVGRLRKKTEPYDGTRNDLMRALNFFSSVMVQV